MKASDNPYPSLLLAHQGSAPATPATDTARLFVDDADGLLKLKDDAGVVTNLGASGLSDHGVITYLDGTVAAAPATPAAGKLRIYAKTGKVLAVKDDAGVETVLGAGGGGSVTIQRPALYPGSPTDDFDGASLGGGYTAHSSGGSFATGHCKTQGVDWLGSSLEMQYSDQLGVLHVAHSNTDLDFTWGGVCFHGEFTETAGPGNEVMYGIVALDSAGTGVGVVAYTADHNAYLATITTWGYTAFSDTHAHGGGGGRDATHAQMWFRLKRVSGTWTGYVSKSGRVWDKTFSTRADSITVDKLAFGLFFDISKVYSGRLTADYLHVAV